MTVSVIRRSSTKRVAPRDATTTRISPHFLLSDFLGCDTVYREGRANVLDPSAPGSAQKMANLQALCFRALEPLVAEFGPLSISYGYISPELSRAIVKYQDPDKPSHHRFDLGAAVDIRVHNHVDGVSEHIGDLWLPETARGSPIALAHYIDVLDIPYSRLITYSESPFVCLAVSADEVGSGVPRKMMYENRYQGPRGGKPEFLRYSTQRAKNTALRTLQEQGLEYDWRGAGYPTYHGGGRRQLHHTQVSKYTVVSDWLFDLKSISKGTKNVPLLHKDEIADSFAAAGTVYDAIIDSGLARRLSVVSGYVSHMNPYFDPGNDWRTGSISFTFAAPDSEAEDLAGQICQLALPGVEFQQLPGQRVRAFVNVEEVLSS